MRFVKDLLPHLLIAMLLGLIVLIVLDERNPLMYFLTSGTAKIYMLIMCAVGIATSAMCISDRRK